MNRSPLAPCAAVEATEHPSPGRVHSSEHERIGELARLFAGASDDVLLGIGDDCAVLRTSERPLVCSVDASVEGVHFRRDWMSFEDIGYRATMAALSDLAAMGARPLGVLSALSLPADLGDAELFALARGQRCAAHVSGTTIVGGNLTKAGELSLTTTVVGEASRPLRRDGAREGDGVWLSGSVGLAGLGLELLARGVPHDAHDPAVHAALSAFRRPRARIAEGQEAAGGGANSAIDLSDGLVADLGHLARASSLVIELDESRLRSLAPVVPARLELDPLELVLFGGEDYALVVTAPAASGLNGWTRIGTCIRGTDSGVVLRGERGVRPVSRRGFDHFAR